MPEAFRGSLDSARPLSRMKTEMVWDGKYDEYGARCPVDIARSAIQKIRAVDMPEA